MSGNGLRVLIAGAEAVPFAKTGGLADVIGTLPGELKKVGVDARVIMPKHGIIKHEYAGRLRYIASFYITFGWRSQYVGVETMEMDGVTYYFIDNEYYFYNAIYKGGEAEGEQYAFFSRAVLEALPYIDFEPDVLHVNDWHTATIPMMLKTQYAHRPQGKLKTVFTIHNLQYQGAFSFGFARHFLGVEDRFLAPEYMEAYGAANFMKAGIVFADKVTTVSPNYAREIRENPYGRGMDGILRARGENFIGIVNGIDIAEYDPRTDRMIEKNYSEEDLTGKAVCKRALKSEFALDLPRGTPVIGMVTRMTEQKGLDLVRNVLESLLLEENLGFVILGNGDAEYESYFNYIAGRFPGRAGVYIGYKNGLAHRIYAGCDLFLMPSLFEPCGISQMIAQRYGTLPIVRETGGLKDTVFPYNKYTGEGSGFSFAGYNAGEMLAVIKMAFGVLRQVKAKKQLVKNAMLQDNSFTRSAKEYLRLYGQLIAK